MIGLNPASHAASIVRCFPLHRVSVLGSLRLFEQPVAHGLPLIGAVEGGQLATEFLDR